MSWYGRQIINPFIKYRTKELLKDVWFILKFGFNGVFRPMCYYRVCFVSLCMISQFQIGF